MMLLQAMCLEKVISNAIGILENPDFNLELLGALFEQEENRKEVIQFKMIGFTYSRIIECALSRYISPLSYLLGPSCKQFLVQAVSRDKVKLFLAQPKV